MAEDNEVPKYAAPKPQEKKGQFSLELPSFWSDKKKVSNISRKLVYPYMKINVAHDFSSEITKATNDLVNVIKIYLEESWISISALSNSNIIQSWLLKWVLVFDYVENGVEKNIAFNLHAWDNPKKFFGGSKEDILAKKEKQLSKAQKYVESADRVLDAMEYVFNKNDREVFGYLNNQGDIVDTDEFWKEFQWLNLQELSEFMKFKMTSYNVSRAEVDWKLQSDQAMLDIHEKYLDMLMWIWDKYEWWAEYLKKRYIDISWETTSKTAVIWNISSVDVNNTLAVKKPFEIVQQLRNLLDKKNAFRELQSVLSEHDLDDVLDVSSNINYSDLSLKWKKQIHVITHMLLQVEQKGKKRSLSRRSWNNNAVKNSFNKDGIKWLFISAHNSQSHGLWLLDRVVVNKSIPELIDYVRRVNRDIDENNYQSTPVENSYESFTDTLHTVVLDRLKNEWADDSSFLDFVKIISWEEENASWIAKGWVDNNISSNKTTVKIINEVMFHLLSKKDGLLEKVKIEGQEWLLENLEDTEVWTKKPAEIVSEFKELVDSKVTTMNSTVSTAEQYLIGNWYNELLSIWEKDSYVGLLFDQKVKISLLSRVIKKIKQKDTLAWLNASTLPPENNYMYQKTGDNSFLQIPEKDLKKVDEGFTIESLGEMFHTAASDTQESLIEQMTDKFQWGSISTYWGWKEAQDIWLTKQWDIDIYNFFKYYQWVGVWNFSNATLHTSLFIWSITATIAIAIWTLPLAAGLASANWAVWASLVLASLSKNALATWMSIWAIGWVASVGMNPTWSDSPLEGALNPLTEISLWTATWYVGWWLVGWFWKSKILSKLAKEGSRLHKWFWVEWAQWWQKWYMANKWIFIGDLAFLWMWTEVIRMMTIDWIFHEDSIYSDEYLKEKSKE